MFIYTALVTDEFDIKFLLFYSISGLNDLGSDETADSFVCLWLVG